MIFFSVSVQFPCCDANVELSYCSAYTLNMHFNLDGQLCWCCTHVLWKNRTLHSFKIHSSTLNLTNIAKRCVNIALKNVCSIYMDDRLLALVEAECARRVDICLADSFLECFGIFNLHQCERFYKENRFWIFCFTFSVSRLHTHREN